AIISVPAENTPRRASKHISSFRVLYFMRDYPRRCSELLLRVVPLRELKKGYDTFIGDYGGYRVAILAL
ncbi:MAG: hypothetical protein KAR33_12295, partial [Candidatus Thorarchaeota archaeon]|nr:hypothetical protein [Candidatus Thorarchaeota archaeon]